MAKKGELLVAIINNLRDFDYARRHHWYRVPVDQAQNRLKEHWPPQWLAFYQTKIFGAEKYSVRYYAQVTAIQEQQRWQLFPDEPDQPNRNKRYYQLFLEPLQQLPQPILSRRWRVIVFIPTTWDKFINAVEINDLYMGSVLEDLLWAELKRLRIPAEREFYVPVGDQHYFLDFAVMCAKGEIDIETDGDLYHANSEKSAEDNKRNNDLETVGWHILRFTTQQIREQMDETCLYQVVKTINNLGGYEGDGFLPRKIDDSSAYQPGLFDNL